MVDALTWNGDEGRCVTAILSVRRVTAFDPGASEWGNPVR